MKKTASFIFVFCMINLSLFAKESWESFKHKTILKLIKQNKLSNYCSLIKKSSENALSQFADETLDFLHIDGNHCEQLVFQDVTGYFSKVKDGGYILLNDPNWYSGKLALVFLLERTDLISSFSPSATHLLFRKNNQRMENACVLFKNEKL